MKKFADVIVPLPIPGQYTYAVPLELEEKVCAGIRVIVPFGKKKYYTAIVTRVHEDAPAGYDTKELMEILDKKPILLKRQYDFWQWIADYYLCTLGDVYKAALPSGMKLESETLVVVNPDYEAESPLTEKEQLVLDTLSRDTGLCINQLEKITGIKNLLPVINKLLEREAIYIKEELKRNYKPRTEVFIRLAETIKSETDLHQSPYCPTP